MDQRVLAYINLYAVLGSLKTMCHIDDNAQKLISGKNISVGFAVKDGPSATIAFKDGKCFIYDGTNSCTIKLPFKNCEKLNDMVNGKYTPMPSKGLTKVSFLLREFTQLTDMLSKYLRPSEEDLKNEQFFDISTKIMFDLVLSAVAQIGNEDKIGMASAGYITDGAVKFKIFGGPVGYITVRDHKLKAALGDTDDFTSYMEFADMSTARDLFDGKINAVASVGLGKVRIGGMISQVDNINRIMDRITLYLS